MTPAAVRALLGTAFATAARVALGALWLNEGMTKYRAGFGRADVLLVVQSTAGNSRVPDFEKWFTHAALGGAPELFGIVVPLLESGLGILLVLGVLSRPAALVSTFELCQYWLADQLIAQYPIMVALSALVLVAGPAASRWSLSAAALRGRAVPAGLRGWL